MYFRRWTRMFWQPALKYFDKYGVLNNITGFQRHLLHNREDPPSDYRRIPYKKSKPERDLDTKLINKLFLKYPDLKYEPINNQQNIDKSTTFSYAFSFITEQKKLMKKGFDMNESFKLTEEKFHERMKRKLDQSLLSRGLAMSNRARSFLSVYQQQIQYQSRLKMRRTQRQLYKYEQKLDKIDKIINNQSAEQQQNDEQYYKRIFIQISNKKKQKDDLTSHQNRKKIIEQLEGNFTNMFQQFYERVSVRDKLQGLTDEQIKKEILISPMKIKNHTKGLLSYLKNKFDISLSEHGQIIFGDSKIDEKTKRFLLQSPKVKIALLNEALGYEKPGFFNVSKEERFSLVQLRRLLLQFRSERLSKEDFIKIKQNKKKEMETVIGDIIDFPSYRYLQTQEERLIRLEITYLTKRLSDKEDEQINEEDLNITIQKLRRLKFQAEKIFRKNYASELHSLLFDEHTVLEDLVDAEKDVEYETLMNYLKRRTIDRRKTNLDIMGDNKINEIVQPQEIPEIALSEGKSKHH